MSLADKVAALRAFFGVNPDVQLLPAVEAMHAAMGSVAEGALPAQVDALVQATGVVVSAAPAVAAPVAAPIAAPAAASKASGKRKADSQEGPPAKQRTLFAMMPNASKTTIHRDELKKQRQLAADGIEYTPRLEDRKTFDSEHADSSARVCLCLSLLRGCGVWVRKRIIRWVALGWLTRVPRQLRCYEIRADHDETQH